MEATGLLHTYLPIKMEQTECSETSACRIQTPGNHPKESIKHSEHVENFKSRSSVLSVLLSRENTANSNQSNPRALLLGLLGS
jgi:hypothetical protein